LLETLLCSGLATMLARGYSPAHLCERFTVTPEQLRRAGQAPALGAAFRPLGDWRWQRVQLPEQPEAGSAQAAAWPIAASDA